MLHSHLLGFIHAQENINRQEEAVNAGVKGGTVHLFNAETEEEVKVVIDERTIDSIREDAGVDQAYIDEIESQMSGMLSDRAKLDFYDNMEALKTVLVENVPTGYGYRDFLKKIGRDQAMENIGLAGEKPYYIETVYRTNYASAHSAGRWKAAQASPLVVKLEYQAVLDDRTTDNICRPMNGTIRDKKDPFWSSYMPPNHFSCRSSVSELTESYVAINGVEETEIPTDLEVPNDFQSNPGESDSWMKSSKGMKQRLNEYEG